jgi:hypothetical protein
LADGGTFTGMSSNDFPAPTASPWTAKSTDDEPGFTELVLGDTHTQDFSHEEHAFPADGSAPPPQAPSEAKVPESSTLYLLGSGMIALAGAARRKWSFRTKSATRFARARLKEA